MDSFPHVLVELEAFRLFIFSRKQPQPKKLSTSPQRLTSQTSSSTKGMQYIACVGLMLLSVDYTLTSATLPNIMEEIKTSLPNLIFMVLRPLAASSMLFLFYSLEETKISRFHLW